MAGMAAAARAGDEDGEDGVVAVEDEFAGVKWCENMDVLLLKDGDDNCGGIYRGNFCLC